MIVEIKRINSKYIEIPLPTYATEGSAGMDIYSAMDNEITISVGAVEMIPTNLSIALEKGFECQVRSRSGLAAKNGVFCLNSPGTIDSDYRGEIRVILANFGKEDFVVKSGDRIAQLVIARYEHITWAEKEILSKTIRGSGGFGSTGV